MIHELKELPEYFESVLVGDKTFELRRADRDFRVGDHLALNEFVKEYGYTGRSILARITYMLDPRVVIGCGPGYMILGIQIVGVERKGGVVAEGLTFLLENKREEINDGR